MRRTFSLTPLLLLLATCLLVSPLILTPVNAQWAEFDEFDLSTLSETVSATFHPTSTGSPSPSASFSPISTAQAAGGNGGDTKLLKELSCEDKVVLARLYSTTSELFATNAFVMCNDIRRAGGYLTSDAAKLVNSAKSIIALLNKTSVEGLAYHQAAKAELEASPTLTTTQRILQSVTDGNSLYSENITAAFQAAHLDEVLGQWVILLNSFPGVNALAVVSQWKEFQTTIEAFQHATLDNYVNKSESTNTSILNMYALQQSLHATFLPLSSRLQRAFVSRYVRFHAVWSAAIGYSLQFVVAGRAGFENANVTNRETVSHDFQIEQGKVHDMFIKFHQQSRETVIVNSIYTDLYSSLSDFSTTGSTNDGNFASLTTAPQPLLVFVLTLFVVLLFVFRL